MLLKPTPLAGLFEIETSPHADNRGSFARTYCADTFKAHGLVSVFEQSSVSKNLLQGTLRGMHFQHDPHAETKYVRCTRGSVFDVAVDLRPGSPTLGQWFGLVLSEDNGRGVYIPQGFAHGFQTLEDHSDVLYQITPAFVPGYGTGVRWDDPAFCIDWPLPVSSISDKDTAYPDWQP